MANNGQTLATEGYIAGIRALVLDQSDLTSDERSKIAHARLMYGVGRASVRGACYYSAWENGVGTVDVVEIGAAAQESWVQVAGTTVHELGHVLAGMGSGHGKDWKAACVRLGFRIKPAAAGQRYSLAQFGPTFRESALALATAISHDQPKFMSISGSRRGPCQAGIGVAGGKSRGIGSGSRLRLYECQCEKPVKVRVASDEFAAHCDECGAAFAKVER